MFLAYKFVGIAVLVAEANFSAEKLNLPIGRPIQESRLTFKMIAPISVLKDDGFGGSIHVDNYAFSEGGRARYRYITRLDPFGGLSMAAENEMLSHHKSLVGTNGAYRLASNWLALIDVDVRELERTNRVQVQQRWYWGEGSPTPRVLLPIFEVTWGGGKVRVTVDGRTRQFVDIRQEDDSFSRRPVELLRDLDKLLAIQAEAYRPPSVEERVANLIGRGMKIGLILLVLGVVACGSWGVYLTFFTHHGPFDEFPTSREQVVRDFLTRISEGTDKSYEKAFFLVSFRYRQSNDINEIYNFKALFARIHKDFNKQFGPDWIHTLQISHDQAHNSFSSDDETETEFTLGDKDPHTYTIYTQVQIAIFDAITGGGRNRPARDENGKNHFGILEIEEYPVNWRYHKLHPVEPSIPEPGAPVATHPAQGITPDRAGRNNARPDQK